MLYKTDKRSLFFLNITQFLGALNDNYFKFLVAYFLINLKGSEFASSILSVAAAIFIIPFLLFSSAAGILADRLSKRKIIVAMKFTELIVTSFSIVALYFKSELGLYFLLFMVAAVNAIFGPSKYGIIPEFVESKKVSKANGLISSFTYLAIIIGTFLVSFITDVSNKNFFVTALACIIFAGLGFVASLSIAKTESKNSTKKINPFFFYEIYQTLVLSSKKENLLTCVFGSAFFLFIAGFTQLNAIPFAIQHLGLSEVGGGYLFLLTGVGIAIGSILSGKISRDGVEVGISSIAGLSLAILLLLLCFFAKSLIAVIILLVLLGISGGVFLIPFDAFIQVKSPDQNRGQIIAAANFLGFCGALLAAISLYIINDTLEYSPAAGFFIIGLITLVFTIFLAGRTSNLFLPFVAKKILAKFYRIKVENIPATDSILILEKSSWREAFLLYYFLPDLSIYTTRRHFYSFPFFNKFVKSIFIANIKKESSLIKTIEATKKRDSYACLFSKEKMGKELLDNFHHQILFVRVKREKATFHFSFSSME